MPKFIEHFMVAKFESIQKTGCMNDKECKWREGYIGFQGELYMLESTKKHPGQQYLYFTDHRGNYLKTSCGKCEIKDNKVMITTLNSIYTFKILYEG